MRAQRSAMTPIRSGGVREGWGAQKSRMITWHDPAPIAAFGAAMDGLEYVRAIIDGQLPSPPITQLMQFEPVSVEPGKAGVHLYARRVRLQRRQRRLWRSCLHTAGHRYGLCATQHDAEGQGFHLDRDQGQLP